MPALPAVSAEHRQRMREVSHRLSEVYGVPQWRQPLPAVDELVCTFLSQNTNDVNRDKAFSALKAHYPTWEAVRDADPQELIDVIRTAGLANQKGPRIQEALKAISAERGEISLEWLRDLPTDQARDWLVNLKGVGPKTAAIVLVFSLGMPAFPVDTHIYRVSGRIGLRPPKLDVVRTHDYLAAAADPADYGPLHLNLIRLGREVCQARKPACWRCPLLDLCQYPQKNLSPS